MVLSPSGSSLRSATSRDGGILPAASARHSASSRTDWYTGREPAVLPDAGGHGIRQPAQFLGHGGYYIFRRGGIARAVHGRPAVPRTAACGAVTPAWDSAL